MTDERDSVRHATLEVALGAHRPRLRYFDRPGAAPAFVYVHGLGCSRDDFLDLTQQADLRSSRLLSYDQPGCGESPYVGGLDIDRLVELVDRFLDALGLRDVVLVAGSMGGLVGLLYAQAHPERLRAFVNIEGNLAPEDCMFSRQVVGHTFDTFQSTVFPRIQQSLAERPGRGFARHLAAVSRADPRAYYEYCAQLVAYSDHGGLLERFLGLPLPTCFVYGSANRHLSYLPRLRESSCRVVEIADADHFLFYDDPAALAAALKSYC